MKKLSMALVIVMGVLVVALTRAEQDDKPADGGKAPRAEDARPVKGPHIAIEPDIYDFGKAVQHKTLTTELSIRNTGNEDLVIETVTTSCGCTAAVAGEKTIKPGASTPLRVDLETRAAVGKLERQVI